MQLITRVYVKVTCMLLLVLRHAGSVPLLFICFFKKQFYLCAGGLHHTIHQLVWDTRGNIPFDSQAFLRDLPGSADRNIETVLASSIAVVAW